MGSPLYGDVSAVVRSSAVREALLVSAIDTGEWTGLCNSSTADQEPMLPPEMLTRRRAGAWPPSSYTTNCTAMLIPTPHAEVMAFYPEKLPVYGKRAWYATRLTDTRHTLHPPTTTRTPLKRHSLRLAGAAQSSSFSRSTPRWSAATSGSTRRRPTGCSASFRI